MPTSITFFPPSQPDETLNSRVSRYHLIAGNSTTSATLEELFCNPLTGLDQIVPPPIDVLAARLPGDSLPVPLMSRNSGRVHWMRAETVAVRFLEA
jgi:hypothetical protein